MSSTKTESRGGSTGGSEDDGEQLTVDRVMQMNDEFVAAEQGKVFDKIAEVGRLQTHAS
jgi:hypothetical protein